MWRILTHSLLPYHMMILLMKSVGLLTYYLTIQIKISYKLDIIRLFIGKIKIMVKLL